MVISPFTWAKWGMEHSLGRKLWVQRGHSGRRQIKTEEKTLSAKVVIRGFKNYFLTIKTALAECNSPLGEVTQWTNTIEQEIKCQTMHTIPMISLYTSYFQTMAGVVCQNMMQSPMWVEWHQSYTMTKNPTVEMRLLAKFFNLLCHVFWKPTPASVIIMIMMMTQQHQSNNNKRAYYIVSISSLH